MLKGIASPEMKNADPHRINICVIHEDTVTTSRVPSQLQEHDIYLETCNTDRLKNFVGTKHSMGIFVNSDLKSSCCG